MGVQDAWPSDCEGTHHPHSVGPGMASGRGQGRPSLPLWTALHPVVFEFLHPFPVTPPPFPASPLTSPTPFLSFPPQLLFLHLPIA